MTTWANHETLEKWYLDAVEAVEWSKINWCGQWPMRFDSLQLRVTARRSGKAGTCRELRREIWLNAYMTEAHAKDTFLHELAHLFSYWFEPVGEGMFRRSWNHGPVFKKWAKALGDDGGRCHDYPEIHAVKRGEWAHCPSCHLNFKKQWRLGDCSFYRCRPCRVSLKPGQYVAKPENVFARAVASTMPAPAVQVAEGAGVRDLVFQLGALKDGGLASSREAKALRRQLRKLGHTGGAR